MAISRVGGDKQLIQRPANGTARLTPVAGSLAVTGDVAAGMATVDNNSGSAFRVQQDARHAADYARTAKRPVNLRELAADLDFTGATFVTTDLQAALDAAGAGSTVEWGRDGVLKSGPLTMYEHQTLVGAGQYTGAGGAPQSELKFPGLTSLQVGITGGGNSTLRRVLLRGPHAADGGDSIGFKSVAGSPRFEEVGFFGFGYGDWLGNAYYATYINCEWSRNKEAHVNDAAGGGNYNLTFVNPKMFCQYGTADALFGMGLDGAGRAMNVFGGSIEGYGASGGVTVAGAQQLNMWGTYFESSVVGSNAFGIIAAGQDGVTINLHGLMVYLTEHNRFMHLDGATDTVVNSDGNHFVCPDASATAPYAYYFDPTDVGQIRGRIGVDNWTEVLKTGALYAHPSVIALGAIPDLDIRHPDRSHYDGAGTVLTVRTATASISAATEETVVFNGSSLTAHLPDPTTLSVGRTFRVKNIHSTSLTVDSNGTSKTIDGAASVSLAQWAKGQYVTDGTQWLSV